MGAANVELPVARRHGLLNRLATDRPRVPPAPSLASEGIDQVHSATPLPIGTRLGTFEVTGVLHRDLSGIVYAGEDRSSPGKVAIKEYLPATLSDRMASGKVGLRSLRYKASFQEGKERFLSNGRMLAALDEPALIRVVRCWKQNGTTYMAMPLYEGQTLGEVLRATPKPSEAWLKSMLGPLLDALATLHRFDCYPCNVTPDNVVMLQDGTPLLFAFGAGRRTTPTSSADLRHDLDPGFAPIEQYAHDPTMPEGPWTDVYAVAAVIRYAITGKHLPALAARMAADTLPSLREVDTEYSAIFLDAIDRGVAVLPRDRPQTISEFRRRLGIHQLGSGGIATALSEVPQAAETAARRKTKVSAELSPESEVVVPEGTGAVTSHMDSIVLPPSASVSDTTEPEGTSQPAMQSSPGGLPWKLTLQVFVVGLFALGLLVWTVIERRQATPTTGDRAASAVAGNAQPSNGLVTTPVASTETAPVGIARPSAAEMVSPRSPNPPSAEPTPPARVEPSVARVASVPSAPAAAAESAAPGPRTGKIRLSIRPWGEVVVDGKSKGVSPPLKELSIPEGRHRIQIRNGDFAGYDSELDVKAGSKDEIAYSFKAP